MENPLFEDVFPMQDGGFPFLCLFLGGYVFFLGGGEGWVDNHKLVLMGVIICFASQMFLWAKGTG